MTRSQHWVSLVCNIATVIFVAYATYTMISNMASVLSFSGIKSLRLFTVDSNLLAALSCLVMIPFNIAGIRRPGRLMPKGALLFKFVGTVSVTVTFLTVMCFLGPTIGYASMLTGPNFWLHLVCPILCIVSLWVFEKGEITIPQSLLGLLPVVVYGAWYMVMVVFIGEANGGWNDWYGFNRGGMWVFSLIIMGLATLVICLIERLPHRMSKREKMLAQEP